MNCLICNEEFKYLGRHVKNDHKLTNKNYYDKYLKTAGEGVCVTCGKETPYLERFKRGYQASCSIKCSRVPLMIDPAYRAKTDKNKSEISKKNWAKSTTRRAARSELSKRMWKNEAYRKTMKSEKTRNKISKTISNGIKNDPEKYCVNYRTKKGWFESKKNNNKIYYQSSYELRFLEIIEQSDQIKSFKRPDFTIKYIKPSDNCLHRYSADFIVDYNNGLRELVEVKANWQIKKDITIRAKAEASIRFCTLSENLTYRICSEEFLFSSSLRG